MTRQASEAVWPSASPPPASPALTWRLRDIAELPGVRAQLRRHSGLGAPDPDRLDQLILALDEMASNALRHGGGHVRATVRLTAAAYLIEVSDRAAGAPPTPAVGRDPSEGGLGLYLIAEMASEHGWYVAEDHKFVWALIPRT